MVTLILGAAGAAIGGSIGGAILGVSAATICGFIGSTIGSVVDSWIISSLAPAQRIESARLDTLRITFSTEGAVIPRLHGRMRMGGNIIWATDFREETKTTTQGGGKGGGGKVKTTEYLYYASFAVALCEGPITGIGRIWADGKPMDLSGVTSRWYPGDEAQTADPFITARMGAAGTPAYRGTAYVVFEELALSTYGNRLPQLTEDQPAHRPFVAAHAVPWPGEMTAFRSPSTDGFELLTTFGSRARIGALVSDFFAGPTARFDLGNALVVDLLTGTLESVTDLTLFGGANALAIESAPGTWEIVQADAAELLAPGRYQLTRLLHGQRGTEGAMGNPALSGARVVVLDTALASLPIAEADLGIPWNWRVGPASRPVSDETYVAQTFTPEGVGLRPFSVAHVEQACRRPRTPGDLMIRWTRRSRALSADSWSGLEVPLGEELEAYEVEILDGTAVKRVLPATTTSSLYTAAQQTADWGAPLGPGDTLDIRIFQLSALVGRGAPKTVTLTF